MSTETSPASWLASDTLKPVAVNKTYTGRLLLAQILEEPENGSYYRYLHIAEEYAEIARPRMMGSHLALRPKDAIHTGGINPSFVVAYAGVKAGEEQKHLADLNIALVRRLEAAQAIEEGLASAVPKAGLIRGVFYGQGEKI